MSTVKVISTINVIGLHPKNTEPVELELTEYVQNLLNGGYLVDVTPAKAKAEKPAPATVVPPAES